MPPWYLPLLAQGIETTLSKLSKTRLGTIHNLPERERERARARMRRSVRSTHSSAVFSPELSPSTSQGPENSAFIWKSCGSRTRFTQERGFQSHLLLPSVLWRSQGLCGSLGVCATPACPSPSSTSIPIPFQMGDYSQALLLSHSFLLAFHPSSHSVGLQTPSETPAHPWQREKHPEPLSSLVFWVWIACVTCMRLWKCSTCHETFDGWASAWRFT